jgi:hypothetical protein
VISAAVTFVHQLSGVEIYLHLHLPNILVGKLSHFEINQDKAFQEIVQKFFYFKLPQKEVSRIKKCKYSG